MRLGLDTNAYSDLAANQREAAEVVALANEILVPFAVIAELRQGFLGGSRAEHNEQVLQRFLQWPRVSVLYPDADTLEQYAALAVDLKRRGRRVPHNDLWIAALCVQHGLTLLTRDRHFDQLPQVKRA